MTEEKKEFGGEELSSGSEKIRSGRVDFERQKVVTKSKVVVANAENPEVGRGYEFEVLKLNELSPEKITEISEFFRYTFSNAFPEYVVCTDCEKSISAPVLFGVGRNYVKLEEMDACELPDCEDCGEVVKFFHDKEMTRIKLEEKFKMEGRMVLVTSKENNEIQGMTFGYCDSLKGVMEKEWGHPYNYMKKEYQDESRAFDVDEATEKIKAKGVVASAESDVFCWNCIVLNPSARRNFTKMTATLAKVLQEEGYSDLPVVAQVLSRSVVKKWMVGEGYSEIDEIFPKEYSFLLGDLGEVCHNFLTKL